MIEKWKELALLIQVSIILLVTGLITMIIGLSIIGSVDHGFSILNIIGVSDVLKMTQHEFGNNDLSQLKAGIVFAVILTPILIGSSIILFIYGTIKG